ncbi:MAG: PhnE/PtxC family ABC transporter permease, partial [Gammaproteobacteria bacterium]
MAVVSRAFRPDWWSRAAWVALAIYVVYAMSRLDFTWSRFVVGLDNGARFLGRMFPPVIAQPDTLVKGLAESLEIAILASFIGVVLALPIGLAAS